MWSLLIIGMSSNAAQAASTVLDIRVTEAVEGIEIVIFCDSEVTYRTFKEPNPPRVAVDILDALHRVPEKIVLVRRPPVLRVRSDQFSFRPSNVVRVVADLTEFRPYTVEAHGRTVVLTVEKDGTGERPIPERAMPDSSDGGAEASPDTSAVPSAPGAATSPDTPAPETPKLSIRLQDVRLEDALKLFTKKTGLNFLFPPGLADRKVSLYLRDVSLQEALSGLLQAHGLRYEQQNGTDLYLIREGPSEPPVEHVTEVIRCQYAFVKDLNQIVSRSITSEGRVLIDERTNSFIITEVPEVIATVKAILSHLDRPSRQVLIDAEIVEFKHSVTEELGINWDWTGTLEENTVDVLSSFSAADGILTLSLGKYASAIGQRNLKAMINALEKEGTANVLANPKIFVLEDHPAIIEITENIALAQKVTVQEGGSTVSEPIFGDVGVTLQVTPHISNDRFVMLEVTPTVSSAQRSAFFPNDAVDTKKRSAQTSVMVEDGETVVLGGLLRTDTQESVSKVPLLGDIPLLGYIFRRRVVDTSKTEVMVFLTPHIVTAENVGSMSQEQRERMDSGGE